MPPDRAVASASGEEVAAGSAPSAPRLEDDVRRALVQVHRVEAQQVQDGLRAAVDTLAVIELLIAKGVIGLGELDARRKQIEAQLAAERARTWTGPQLYPASAEELTRPAVAIDCSSRLSRCQAACCRIYNVYLTAEEVQSGRYKWDLGQPYRLKQRDDGACHYLDPQLGCTIWEWRPHVCRRYSCWDESKIWSNYAEGLVSEHLVRLRARWLGQASAAEGAPAPGAAEGG